MSSNNQAHHRQIARHTAIISMATALSRILGLLRDVCKGYFYGTSMAADAFTAAFRLPNMFRNLLGEGSLNASFVPIYSSYLTTDDPQIGHQEADRFANIIFSLLAIISTTIALAGIWFAPLLVKIILGGFEQTPGKIALTIQLTRMVFPYIVFISLAALVMGVLNSHKRFLFPALSPVFLNLSMILAMLFLRRFFGPLPGQHVIVLAIAVLVGGFLQLSIQIPALLQTGFRFQLILQLSHQGVKDFFVRIIPGIFGLAVYQLNILVDTMLASTLPDGSLAALEYGNRLMQLPLGVFGIAVATAVLPSLSRFAARNEMHDLMDSLLFALRLLIFVMIPATVFLLVMRYPIIHVLFVRGAFSASRSLPMTAQALLFYGLGLVSYSSVKVLAPAFYAQKDTFTPVKIAFIATLINIGLNLILIRFMAHAGLALATAISSFCNTGMLLWHLHKKTGYLPLQKLLPTIKKCGLAAFLMGIFMAFWLLLVHYTPTAPFVSTLIALMVGFAGGAIIYAATAWRLQMPEMKTLIDMVRQKLHR